MEKRPPIRRSHNLTNLTITNIAPDTVTSLGTFKASSRSYHAVIYPHDRRVSAKDGDGDRTMTNKVG